MKALSIFVGMLLLLGRLDAGAADERDAEIARLKERVAALEAELQKLKPPAAPRPRLGAAMEARVEADVQNILTQLQMYEVFNGSFPSTKQGLEALVAKPEGDPAPRRWKQLMPEVPKDPWGKPYRLVYPAVHAKKDGIDVFSAGPDGQYGTADDIGNW